MQIETGEIVELPGYTETARYKRLKNQVYQMAKNGTPFHMPELAPDEYKYYSEMWFIFRKLIAKDITPEEASEENDIIYKQFCENRALTNQRIFDVIEWNENIKKSEAARIKINKAQNIVELLTAMLECIEALTGDKTMRRMLELAEGAK